MGSLVQAHPEAHERLTTFSLQVFFVVSRPSHRYLYPLTSPPILRRGLGWGWTFPPRIRWWGQFLSCWADCRFGNVPPASRKRGSGPARFFDIAKVRINPETDKYENQMKNRRIFHDSIWLIISNINRLLWKIWNYLPKTSPYARVKRVFIEKNTLFHYMDANSFITRYLQIWKFNWFFIFFSYSTSRGQASILTRTSPKVPDF